jgi:hypothetical protein
MHFTNEALKLTALDVAKQFDVSGCIILADDGEGGFRMAAVGLSSEPFIPHVSPLKLVRASGQIGPSL